MAVAVSASTGTPAWAPSMNDRAIQGFKSWRPTLATRKSASRSNPGQTGRRYFRRSRPYVVKDESNNRYVLHSYPRWESAGAGDALRGRTERGDSERRVSARGEGTPVGGRRQGDNGHWGPPGLSRGVSSNTDWCIVSNREAGVKRPGPI